VNKKGAQYGEIDKERVRGFFEIAYLLLFAVVFFDEWKMGHGSYAMTSICAAGEIISLFLLVHHMRDKK
jgi:hypothetical protein